MFAYRVFDDKGNYLGKVEHERELVRSQCVMQDGTNYRINYIGGGGTLRVSEVADPVWEAVIQPPKVSQDY
jgi:hypothetical protein